MIQEHKPLQSFLIYSSIPGRAPSEGLDRSVPISTQHGLTASAVLKLIPVHSLFSLHFDWQAATVASPVSWVPPLLPVSGRRVKVSSHA